MNKVNRDIFKAIHEGKWLKIEYRNLEEKITKFWVGIRDLDVVRRKLFVSGLHLGNYSFIEEGLNHLLDGKWNQHFSVIQVLDETVE